MATKTLPSKPPFSGRTRRRLDFFPPLRRGDTGGCFDRSIAFPQEVFVVGDEAGVTVHAAGGPPDLDRVDAGRLPEPEVDSGVAAGLEAGAADPEADALSPRARDRDSRAHGIAIRSGSCESKADEMSPRLGPVVQQDERLVLDDDNRIEAAIVVEIADGQPSPQVQGLEGST